MHTIPIPFNTTSFDYTVVINEDDLYELDETFTLQITATSGTKVKIGRPASTTITITNRNNRKFFVYHVCCSLHNLLFLIVE